MFLSGSIRAAILIGLGVGLGKKISMVMTNTILYGVLTFITNQIVCDSVLVSSTIDDYI